jgi:hypothetical protein
LATSASADGQLEQPSDVNNSTTAKPLSAGADSVVLLKVNADATVTISAIAKNILMPFMFV